MVIKLTDKAKEKILESNKKGIPVKVAITGYSWCGANIGIVSEKQEKNDKIYKIEGANIVVSSDLIDSMKSMTIEYSNNWLTKGFEVIPEF